MITQNTTNFKGIYETTSYVQNHTLINRGITTIGGSTIPQCIMSNNKDETRERALMGGIYFVASYLTPMLLIPLYNKHFLKNKGITKSLNDLGKKIIEVPKRYLTPNADLKEGLSETAKNFGKQSEECKNAFDEIYKRYDNPQKLKKDLLDVHEKVLTTDFITTAAMWSAIPWIATETTEKRTHRSDFSAGFNLKKDNTKENKKYSKFKKVLANIAFCTIPAVLFSKGVTKGINLQNGKSVKKISDKIWKKFTKNPDNFNYTSGTNMSKTIYASIWLLSSFPSKIISSRDKNERKDRALRDAGLFAMFFGGDFLINNILGRTADKLFGTKIMNTDKYKDKKLNFVEKFKLPIRDIKNPNITENISPKILKKTKNIGAGVYWMSLLTNTALIGFALPKFLNKFLRHNIEKEKKQDKINHINNIKMNTFINNTNAKNR